MNISIFLGYTIFNYKKEVNKMKSNAKQFLQNTNYLNSLKMEISSELGINTTNSIVPANRTAKENGRIGGQMTKKLVELGKQHLNSI